MTRYKLEQILRLAEGSIGGPSSWSSELDRSYIREFKRFIAKGGRVSGEPDLAEIDVSTPTRLYGSTSGESSSGSGEK